MRKWKPFERAVSYPINEENVKAFARKFLMTEAEVRQVMNDVRNDIIYLNNLYQVNLRLWRGPPEMVHLSIKRRDKERVGVERYRDFLRIKNELVGPEFEACEIYPAMSRNVDSANQYHLWCLPAEEKFPFGFQTGLMTSDSIGGAKQHPHEE